MTEKDLEPCSECGAGRYGEHALECYRCKAPLCGCFYEYSDASHYSPTCRDCWIRGVSPEHTVNVALEIFAGIRKERDEWKMRSNWWEHRKAATGADVRDLYALGRKFLPEDLAADLGFASTTVSWFIRLADWIKEKSA